MVLLQVVPIGTTRSLFLFKHFAVLYSFDVDLWLWLYSFGVNLWLWQGCTQPEVHTKRT